MLVLVSDGEENRPPYIDEVKPNVYQKVVVVHTILISAAVEKKLVKLAAFTNGKSFFDSVESDSTNLQSAFRSTVEVSESDAPGVAPVEVCCASNTSPLQTLGQYSCIYFKDVMHSLIHDDSPRVLTGDT